MSTRKPARSTSRGGSVFDKYAHEYDLITSASTREAAHRKEVQVLIERFRPAAVLDAGCATGLTSRLFAEAGIKTVGLDREAAMLDQARQIAAERGLSIDFIEGQFEKLPLELSGKFDLIVCLANSIAGVSTQGALLRSVKGFYKALAPGGSFVIQMLNYAAVREGEIRPVRVTEHGGILYARYQERVGKQIILHIIRIDRNQQPSSLEVFVHPTDNFTPRQVVAAIKAAGFAKVVRFGDLFLEKPFRTDSRDLVITSSRPRR